MNAGWCKNFIRAACKIILLVIFMFDARSPNAQQSKIDSIKKVISLAKEDTSKIFFVRKLRAGIP